ncbi:MAG: response regulator [candidate division NC10 bacterium]|nr:response regulator [candidate division NC10 bacterium]
MAGERILAVDDDAFFRTLYQDLLTADGYSVETAANGAQALERLAQGAPDLVLLDMLMPGMDGLETLRRIREARPDLPVVMVTGQQDVRAAVEALKRGAADYVGKPVHADEFRVTVRRLLEAEQTKREHTALLEENLAQLQTLALLARAQEALGPGGGRRRLEALVALAGAEVGAPRAALLYASAAGDRLVPVAVLGYPAGGVAARGIPLGEGLLGTLVARGVPAVLREEEVLERGSAVEQYLVGNGALLIPVAVGGEPRAALLVSRREEGSAFVAGEAGKLLPLTVPLALALKLGEAESASAPAAGIGAGGLPRLEERLEEEIRTSRRYGRACAVLLIGLGVLREVLGEEEAGAAAAGVAASVRDTVRGADTVLALPEGDLGIVVPETDYQGAITVALRIERALRAAPFGEALFLAISAPVSYGVAAFPIHGEGAVALIARARKGLSRGGEGRALTETVWEFLDRLLAEAERGGTRGPRQGSLEIELESRDLKWVVDPKEYGTIEAYIEEELFRSGIAEGVLFLGVGTAAEGPARLPRLKALQGRGLQTVLFASEDGTAVPEADLGLALARDAELDRTRFLLYYGIQVSYGVVGRRDGGTFRGLFTGNALLVNEIMKKLRQQYLGLGRT